MHMSGGGQLGVILIIALGLLGQVRADDLVAVWHFDEGKGSVALDSTGNENDAEVHGARWVQGLFGGALEFDGLDDYVSAAGLGELREGSAEAWVRFGKDHFGQIGVIGFGAGDGGKNDQALLGFGPDSKEGPTNLLAFCIYGVDWQAARSSIAPIQGQWYHLVGTWDKDGMKLYVNGTPAGASAAWRQGIPLHNAVLMGAGSWKQYMKGTLDEVRIYKTALSEAEVRSHYGKRDYVAAPSQIRPEQRTRKENRMRNVADFSSPNSPTGGIQEAIDSLPRSGGCVVVPPGTYLMKQSVHLRSNVCIRGAGASTILKRPPQVRSAPR
jgi:hypothetical protein